MNTPDLLEHTSDVLRDGVHHHTNEPRRVQLSGKPCETLCGLVKTINPSAWSLPCCPMCGDELDSLGLICQADL